MTQRSLATALHKRADLLLATAGDYDFANGLVRAYRRMRGGKFEEVGRLRQRLTCGLFTATATTSIIAPVATPSDAISFTRRSIFIKGSSRPVTSDASSMSLQSR